MEVRLLETRRLARPPTWRQPKNRNRQHYKEQAMDRPSKREQHGHVQYKQLPTRYWGHNDRKHPSQQQTEHQDTAKRSRYDKPEPQQMRKKDELMEMWTKHVKTMFPNVHRRVCFVPPVHFNRVSVKPEILHGEEVNVQIPAKQLSDVRENECTHRMHHTLRCMFEEEEEAMFVVWNLDFDTYLNNLGGLDNTKKTPSHQAESLYIPNGHCRPDPSTPNGRVPPKNGHSYNAGFLRPRDLKPDLQRGKFAVLIISKHHGLVIIEIKAIGDAFGMAEEGMTKEKEHNTIKTKIQKALSQLDKEETVLKYLVSDLSREIPIKKALALPNLKRTKLDEVLRQDSELRNDFCRCFGTGQDVEAALRCCVFSEQLPPFGRAWELQDGDVKKLRQDWWLPLADNGRRQQLDDDLYESLVARFCGPGTPLHVTTTRSARAGVSTLHDAVLETARCLKHWTLTPDQVATANSTGSRVYLTGPPGTGKTVQLMLRILKWARQGHDVIIGSLWPGSHAVSISILRQVQKRLASRQNKVRLHLCTQTTIEGIVRELIQAWSRDPPQLGEDLEKDETFPGEARLHEEQPRDTMDTGAPISAPEYRCADPQSTLTTGQLVRKKGLLADFSPGSVNGVIKAQQEVNGFRAIMVQQKQTTKLDVIPNGYIQEGGGGIVNGQVEQEMISAQFQFQAGYSQTGPGSQQEMDTESPSVVEKDRTTPAKKPLLLIVDEAPWFFARVIDRIEKMKHLYSGFQCWAGSSFFGTRPQSFTEIKLTQSLRCPPVVIRELETGAAYSTRAMYRYATGDSGVLSSLPPLTDGPPVKRISHGGHMARDVWDCEDCGREAANYLTQELHINTAPATEETGTPKDTLKLSDVMVSGYVKLSKHRTSDSQPMDHAAADTDKNPKGFLKGLHCGNVPYDVITKDSEDFPETLACPKEDKVQVAEAECIMGLKRAVVVVIGTTDMSATCPRYVDPWCDVIARCNSQLVVVGDISRLEDRFAEAMMLGC